MKILNREHERWNKFLISNIIMNARNRNAKLSNPRAPRFWSVRKSKNWRENIHKLRGTKSQEISQTRPKINWIITIILIRNYGYSRWFWAISKSNKGLNSENARNKSSSISQNIHNRFTWISTPVLTYSGSFSEVRSARSYEKFWEKSFAK